MAVTVAGAAKAPAEAAEQEYDEYDDEDKPEDMNGFLCSR